MTSLRHLTKFQIWKSKMNGGNSVLWKFHIFYYEAFKDRSITFSILLYFVTPTHFWKFRFMEILELILVIYLSKILEISRTLNIL